MDAVLASLRAASDRLFGSYEFCHDQNVTYAHRVDDPSNFSYCTVPNSGQDALLFGSLAVLITCVLQGKLSAVWVLIAGALLQLGNVATNMPYLSNSIAHWLGMTPADLFLYMFLPPLLLDSAVRTDYFIFKKVLVQVLVFAFLVVMGCTAIMVPILLYVFDLRDDGWRWQHAALFTSMIAGTDAVAVTAIVKGGGGPEDMAALLEGESLFNDASSIVLFDIFLQMVRDLEAPGKGVHVSIWQDLWHMVVKVTVMAAGGAVVGLCSGVATRKLIKWLRHRGAKPPQELAVSLAMAYLTFYVANLPLQVSGVTAVVVLGLYGSATGKWMMSPQVAEAGYFFSFWDTISYAVNGLVFFFAGASAVNFFIRSAEELSHSSGTWVALQSFWRLPGIYVAMFLVRGLCIAAFMPFFTFIGSGFDMGSFIFSTFAGLRGAVSLILAQQLVLDQGQYPHEARVIAEIALWTAGFVVMTLFINAPLLPWVMRKTGLAAIASVKRRMRAKAVRALVRFTNAAIEDLKDDQDEMLRGVDWGMVASYVDIGNSLDTFVGPLEGYNTAGKMQRTESIISMSAASASSAAGRVASFTKEAANRLMGRSNSTEPPLPRYHQEGGLGIPLLGRISENDDPESPGTMLPVDSIGVAEPLNGVLTEAPSAKIRFGAPGPERAGATVAKPWPNNVTQLTRMKGQRNEDQFAEDLPFMGKDLGGDAASGKRQAETLPHGQEEVRPPEAAGGGTMPPPPEPTPGEVERSYSSFASGKRIFDIENPEALEENADSGKDGNDDGTELPPSAMEMDCMLNPQACDPPQRNPSMAGDSEDEDTDKEAYRVLPQPIIAPHMTPWSLRPGEDVTPDVTWLPVDLRGMAGQPKPRSSYDMPNHQLTPEELEGKLGHVQRSFSTPLSAAPSSESLSNRKERHSRDEEEASARRTGSIFAPNVLEGMEEEIDEEDAALKADSDEAVAEARLRLLAGLKRYFHSKAAEGLLSGTGTRMLDLACDIAADKADTALNVWEAVERDVVGHSTVRWMAQALFRTALLSAWLRAEAPYLRPFVRPFVRTFAGFLNQKLSQTMLVGIEVAVEYWLALSHSPQAQWLRYSDPSGCLLQELADESKRVWKFIIEREIEAPDRFQSIQTYRAAMAVLRQQLSFVKQLFLSGMVDATEAEEMTDPIEIRVRKLERRGAVWSPPLLFDILRALPFFSNVPESLFDEIVAAGQLVTYHAGEVIWTPISSADKAAAEKAATAQNGGHPDEDGIFEYAGDGASKEEEGGIFVVLHGIVRSSYVAPDGSSNEYFMGRGSMFSLLPALTGEPLPGTQPVVAEGNLLRKGPVIFVISQKVIEQLRVEADNGDPDCEQLVLDLHRMAALFIVERMRSEIVATVAAHYQHLTLMAARRAAAKARWKRRKREGKDGHDGSDRKGSDSRSHRPGARAMEFLDREFGQDSRHELLTAAQEASQMRAPQFSDGAVGAPDGGTTTPDYVNAAHRAVRFMDETGEQDRRTPGSTRPPGASPHPRPSPFARAMPQADSGGQLQVDGPGAARDPAGQGATDKELMQAMDPRALWVQVQEAAGQVLDALKQGLREAEVLEMGPGAVVKQHANIVVLKGTLRATGHACSVPSSHGGRSGGSETGDFRVVVQYHAPCVLPWVWDAVRPAGSGTLQTQPIPLRAGAEGAVIAVCPATLDTDETESDAVSDDGGSSEGSGRNKGAAARALAAARRGTSGGGTGDGVGMVGLPGRGRIRRLSTSQPLPPVPSSSGSEAVELSTTASGTGKSSAERLKVMRVTRTGMERSA